MRNDAEVALVGAVAGDRGVAVCAGTGAVCVGMNGAHRTARSDGWGYLLGDEGGGYWIGAAALRTLLRRHDGRGRRGRGLEQAMLAALGGIGAPEILDWVYDAPAAVDRIAGLAPVVLAAAASGEPAAAAIVNQAGVRLGRAACAVIRRLELVCETFPLVTLGGLFRSPHATALRTPLENAVRRAAPDGVWRTPVFPAESGAALLGASLDGEAPDGFIANLRLGLDQGRQWHVGEGVGAALTGAGNCAYRGRSMTTLGARQGAAAAGVLGALLVLICATRLGGNDSVADLNLSGRWALLQVTSQIGTVPLVGERTRTTSSFALVDVAQDGAAASGVESACFTTIDYGTSVVAMEIPEAFVRSMRAVEWTATLEPDEAGTRFTRPWVTSVNGAWLADPENDPLPTQADDPRVVDQDGDGKPGLTVRIVVMGLIRGEVYVVQRDRSRLVGVVASPDAVDGLVEWTSEQAVLGASSSIFLGGAPARLDPIPERSYFRARRVDAATDCASLQGAAETLFEF